MLIRSFKWLPAALALVGLASLAAPRDAHAQPFLAGEPTLQFSAVVFNTATGAVLAAANSGPVAAPAGTGIASFDSSGALDGLMVVNGIHSANNNNTPSNPGPFLTSDVTRVINNNPFTTSATVVVSAINFVGPVNQAFASLSGRFLGGTTAGSSIAASWFNNPANVLTVVTPGPGGVGTTIAPAPGNQLDGTFVFTTTGTTPLAFSTSAGPFDVTDPTLFGMNLIFTVILTPGATLENRGQTETKPRIPEIDPGSAASALACLGTGVVILAGGRRKRTPA